MFSAVSFREFVPSKNLFRTIFHCFPSSNKLLGLIPVLVDYRQLANIWTFNKEPCQGGALTGLEEVGMKERRGTSFRNPGFLNQKTVDSFPNLDNSVFFLPIFHYQESLKPDFHMLFSLAFCALDLYIRIGMGLSEAKPVSRSRGLLLFKIYQRKYLRLNPLCLCLFLPLLDGQVVG